MTAIRHTRSISAPIDFLFDYSQCKSCRYQWDPFVSKVYSHDKQDLPQLGTQVTVWTWNHLQMTCRYIQFQRPTCIAIQMTSGPSILKAFGGTWRFNAKDIATTEITFAYSFVLIPRLKGLTPFAKIYFSWDMRRRLNALAKHGAAAYAQFIQSGRAPWNQKGEPVDPAYPSF